MAETTAGSDAAATVHIPLANDPELEGQILFAQWHLVGGRGTSTRVLEIAIQEAELARSD